MTDQYKNNSPAPKITASVPNRTEKDLEKRVREMTDKIHEQDQLIHRMHRDIVRLRNAINDIAAKVK
jgi:hypothetical protein